MNLLSASAQRKMHQSLPYPVPCVPGEDLQPKDDKKTDDKKTKEQVYPHTPDLLVLCIKST